MAKRTLILMRHAKSSWSNPSLADHDRPLNHRGRLAAVRMGAWLLEHELSPDQILCSSSVRTRETAALMQQTGLNIDEVTICDQLYLASEFTILEVVASSSAMNAQRVLVLGHNPGMENLASMLTGQTIAMPTACICVFDFESDANAWRISHDSGCMTLSHYIAPRMLGRELDGD